MYVYTVTKRAHHSRKHVKRTISLRLSMSPSAENRTRSRVTALDYDLPDLANPPLRWLKAAGPQEWKSIVDR